MESLEGKIVVVTGGGSGIGRGMAHAFADAGCVIVVADVDGKGAAEVASELEEKGARALAVETDVTRRESVDALADHAWSELGAVHVLCNNAGIGAGGLLHETTDDDWAWVVDVNLIGVVNGLQAFLPRMKEQEGEKHVVNTASIAGLIPAPGLGAYVATKYAVVGLTETLHLEGQAYGLGATALCPGLVRTAILANSRRRPSDRPKATPVGGVLAQTFAETLEREGMDPMEVGRIVREAVLRNDLYAITHPELWEPVKARFEKLRAAFID